MLRFEMLVVSVCVHGVDRSATPHTCVMKDTELEKLGDATRVNHVVDAVPGVDRPSRRAGWCAAPDGRASAWTDGVRNTGALLIPTFGGYRRGVSASTNGCGAARRRRGQ